MLLRIQSALSLFTCGCLVAAASNPSGIGIVVTNGQAQVDGTVVHGNSTLFQGSVVQADKVTSDLRFSNGSNLVLQPGSAVKVYSEHAVVQQGTVVQRGTAPYALVANGLKVSSSSPQGAVLVGVKDSSHLEVAAQAGSAEVRTAGGDLLARLEPGKTLNFAIGVGQGSSSVTLHGILRQDQSGNFLLTDSATGVTYQIQGSGLDSMVGASVEVTGTMSDAAPAGGASKTISATDVHKTGTGAGVGGQATGGAAPSATTATWTTGSILFVVTVAAGGALLGLAASGDLSGSSAPVSPQ